MTPSSSSRPRRLGRRANGPAVCQLVSVVRQLFAMMLVPAMTSLASSIPKSLSSALDRLSRRAAKGSFRQCVSGPLFVLQKGVEVTCAMDERDDMHLIICNEFVDQAVALPDDQFS